MTAAHTFMLLSLARNIDNLKDLVETTPEYRIWWRLSTGGD